MWQHPRGQLFHRSHLFLLDTAALRVPSGSDDRGRLDVLAAEGDDEARQHIQWRPILLHPTRAQWRPSSVQVHCGWSLAPRPLLPHHPQLVWRAKQYHLGSTISRTQIFPKKTYIEKHKDSPVRISSSICVEGLKVVGSWDEWSSEW